MSQTVQAKQQLIIEQNVKDIKHYINGAFVDAASGKTFANMNPLTNDVMNQVAEGEEADIDKAVAAADRAFKGLWGRLKVKERLAYINNIADIIDEHI